MAHRVPATRTRSAKLVPKLRALGRMGEVEHNLVRLGDAASDEQCAGEAL